MKSPLSVLSRAAAEHIRAHQIVKDSLTNLITLPPKLLLAAGAAYFALSCGEYKQERSQVTTAPQTQCNNAVILLNEGCNLPPDVTVDDCNLKVIYTKSGGLCPSQEPPKEEKPAEPVPVAGELREIRLSSDRTKVTGLDGFGKEVFSRTLTGKVTAYALDMDQDPPVAVAFREGQENRLSFLSNVGETLGGYALKDCLDTTSTVGVPAAMRENITSVRWFKADNRVLVMSNLGSKAFTHVCVTSGHKPEAGLILPGDVVLHTHAIPGFDLDTIGLTRKAGEMYAIRLGLVGGRFTLVWAQYLKGMTAVAQLIPSEDWQTVRIIADSYVDEIQLNAKNGAITKVVGLDEKKDKKLTDPDDEKDQSATGSDVDETKAGDGKDTGKTKDDKSIVETQPTGTNDEVAPDGDKVFLKEDFSARKEGDTAFDWGKDLYILKASQDGRLYLGSQSKGNKLIVRELAFPGENWFLEFDALEYGGTADFNLTFEDKEGNLFTVILAERNWSWHVQLPNTNRAYAAFGGGQKADTIRLVRQGDLFKVFVNGQFVTSNSNAVGEFTGFKLDLTQAGNYFYLGNFRGERAIL